MREDTTGATTRRKKRHIKGREIISICSKCIQVFVHDRFVDVTDFWKQRAVKNTERIAKHHCISCLCNRPGFYVYVNSNNRNSIFI